MKPKNKVLLFDMDGVLVDVNKSYRMAIKKTAETFLGSKVTFEEISSYKKKTGFNNDWDLTEAILLSRGIRMAKQEIIDKFQEYYLGSDFNGLIANERWVVDNALLEKLADKYVLGVFTGRPRVEAEYALKAGVAEKYFSLLIAMEDVLKGKPDPEGIILALKKFGCVNSEAVYFGDTVNDEASAQSAGVRFELVKENVNEVIRKYL